MAVPLPNLNLNTHSAADTSSSASFGAGWTVNFGNQTQGPQVPWYVWAAAGLALIVLAKHHKGRG